MTSLGCCGRFGIFHGRVCEESREAPRDRLCKVVAVSALMVYCCFRECRAHRRLDSDTFVTWPPDPAVFLVYEVCRGL